MTFDQAVQTFGVPGALLAAALVILGRGLYTRTKDADDRRNAEVTAMKTLYEYAEARRIDERDARLEAEARLEQFLPATAHMVELAAQLRKEIADVPRGRRDDPPKAQ